MLTTLKERLVPHGSAPRRVQAGVNHGLVFDLDLRYDTQRYLGLAERELGPWLKRLGRDAKSVIDVGSAEGWYTAYFLRESKAHVYAFEPTDRSAAMLRSIVLNELDTTRVTLTSAFVGTGQDGTVALDSLANTITLPALVKIDVEGAEVDVLRGSAWLMSIPQVRWIIETHSLDNEQACTRVLERAGYRTRIVPNAWWRRIVPEYRPLPHNRWLVATELRGR